MPAGFLPAFCPYECGATFAIADPETDLQGRRRSNRDLATLVRWTAYSLVRQIPHNCLRGRGIQPLYTNTLAMDALRQSVAYGAGRLNVKRLEILHAGWRAGAEGFAALLEVTAGSRRSAFGRRIGQAVDSLRHVAELLSSSRQTLLNRTRPSSARRMGCALNLATAIEEIEFARDCVLEAVQRKAGLPAVTANALIEPQSVPLTGIAEREVIYLARTATPPFRTLAAHRLGCAESRQATATLKQLLFDSDLTTALVALDSIQMRSDSVAPILESAFAGLRESDSPSSSLVTSAIQLALENGRLQSLHSRQ